MLVLVPGQKNITESPERYPQMYQILTSSRAGVGNQWRGDRKSNKGWWENCLSILNTENKLPFSLVSRLWSIGLIAIKILS